MCAHTHTQMADMCCWHTSVTHEESGQKHAWTASSLTCARIWCYGMIVNCTVHVPLRSTEWADPKIPLAFNINVPHTEHLQSFFKSMPRNYSSGKQLRHPSSSIIRPNDCVCFCELEQGSDCSVLHCGLMTLVPDLRPVVMWLRTHSLGLITRGITWNCFKPTPNQITKSYSIVCLSMAIFFITVRQNISILVPFRKLDVHKVA